MRNDDEEGDEECQPTPGDDANELLPQFRDVLLDIDPADPWYTVAVPRRGWRARAPVLTRDQE